MILSQRSDSPTRFGILQLAELDSRLKPMAAHNPRVFTIPASVPFLPTLVTALIEGRLVPGFSAPTDPLVLAATTLYLPTRRACRLVRDVFLTVLKSDAAVLPRIVALGDLDEDEIIFAEAATGASAACALELPPALGGLERRTLLAQLVLKWSAQIQPVDDGAPLVVNGPAAALTLADDLARLMDDMTTRAVSWERLDDLVPDHLDAYWQLTLSFLKIAREQWPKILAERGAIEPAMRRDRMIIAEAARLSAASAGPVIAAGSTGSMPATAKLLATIATLPHGALVLPGLDTDLDEPSWMTMAGSRQTDGADMHPAVGHPQFAMHALITRLGLDRNQVVALGDTSKRGRERLTSEALRPAGTTDRWPDRLKRPAFADSLGNGLATLTMIEAANAEEEALAIAVALRETLEQPQATAALVTPDRALARRVVAALDRWNVVVDDSGGDRLADTTAGVFARLAAEAALGRLAPVTLLALLKHPLFRLDRAAGTHARTVSVLERAVLRGSRPRPGSNGLAHALAVFRAEHAKLRRAESSDLHASDPRVALRDRDLAAAGDLVGALERAFTPLEQLDPTKPCSFRAMAACHCNLLAALSFDERIGDSTAFVGGDGTALALAFADIAALSASADIAIRPDDYTEMFLTVVADRVVRRPGADGSRVCIYGPLEARLTSPDRIVLGGLVEGTWPPDAQSDPWLSRPMRQQLGLDLPERRIGLSAHDFAQLLGTPEVILTRSAKQAGVPTVASRFLQRLSAVAGASHWQNVVAKGERYLVLARALDRPKRVRPAGRPEPRPPRAARPSRLSVTEVEHWLRDPYTIYAKHVLKLVRLEAVDTPLGAADRGSAIHAAVGDFAQTHANQLPSDPLSCLLQIGRARFAPLDDYPEARAFWWPRFERIAQWLIEWETARRESVTAIHAEIRGEVDIPLATRSFRLSARADRIERRADGRYAILDFKTGQVPSDKQVRSGLAPQLTLEAAILRAGGFRDIPAGASVAELAYVQLKGGEPAGKAAAIDFADLDPDRSADKALAHLTDLVIRFEDETTPYRSLMLPMWKDRYGTYDDLARVKEWSQTGGADEGADE
jgi:ATP-dependent helicase/nuclease subunit B